MLVNCDKCGREYDVDESRLPPQGARIKCSSCGNVFLVRPSSKPASDTPELDSALSGASQTDLPKEEETWKVRHMGLTFTFHELTAMQDWMASKTSLEGVTVAKGEDDWHELGDYPEVLSMELITKFFPLGDVPTTENKGQKNEIGSGAIGSLTSTLSGLPPIQSGTMPAAEVPAPNKPKTKKEIAKAKKEARKAAKKEANKKLIIFLIAGIVIVLVAVDLAIFLSTGKQPWEMQNEETQITTSAPAAAPTPEQVQAKADAEKKAQEAAKKQAEEEAEAKRAQERAELLKQEEEKLQAELDEVRGFIQKKQWPQALSTVKAIHEEHPDHLETLELLGQVYRAMGMNEQLAEVEANKRRILEAEKSQEEAGEDMVFGEE